MSRVMSRVSIRSVSTYRVASYEDLDWNKVARYRRALRRRDLFPPIAVIKHCIGLYEILDGFHRFHAHRLEGRKTIQ